MSLLRFEFTPLDYPWPESNSAQLESWARLQILWINNQSSERLLDFQWNWEELFEWYNENYVTLYTKTFPQIRPNESIAAAQLRLFQEMCRLVDAEEEKGREIDFQSTEWIEIDRVGDLHRELYEKCCLDKGLGGAQMPHIFIGINHGAGEISYAAVGNTPDWVTRYPDDFKPGIWVCKFDANDFQLHFKDAMLKYLSEWLTQPLIPHTRKYVEDLVEEVQAIQIIAVPIED